jgi:predicted enzyme related to lactoylglutathione lyase
MSTDAGDRPQVTDQQLVCEFAVADLDRALAFYFAVGFQLVRRDHDFCELSWDGRLLFLMVEPRGADNATNVRVLVPDVDARWQTVQRLGARIITPIRDTTYGLRDFTCCDPDGNRLRFASEL